MTVILSNVFVFLVKSMQHLSEKDAIPEFRVSPGSAEELVR